MLPCVAALLFVAINDETLVGPHLQTACANARALPCVTIACFLAFNVIAKWTVCQLVPGWGATESMAFALPCALASAVGLSLVVHS